MDIKSDLRKMGVVFAAIVFVLMYAFGIQKMMSNANPSFLSKDCFFEGADYYKDEVFSVESLLSGELSSMNYDAFIKEYRSTEWYWMVIDVSCMTASERMTDVFYFDDAKAIIDEGYVLIENGTVEPLKPRYNTVLYPYFDISDEVVSVEKVILKMSHIDSNLSLYQGNRNAFFQTQMIIYSSIILSIGLFTALLFLNLILGYSTKDKMFFYHAFFLACAMLNLVFTVGITRILWQTFSYRFYSWVFMSYASGILLIFEILETQKKYVYGRFLTRILVGVNIAVAIFSFWNPNYWVSELSIYMGFVLVGLIVLFVVLRIKALKRFSKVDVTISAVLAGALILLLLKQKGLVSESYITKYVIIYAVTLLSLVLTMRIASKVKALEAENLKYSEIALKDNLTGLHNRYYLDINMKQLLEMSKRMCFPVTVILFDIDHFKRINDTYGHDVGDEVLKNLATRTTQMIRKSDMFVRWGGEEFLLVLPDTNIDAAVFKADAIRLAVMKTPIYKEIGVQISCGVTLWDFEEDIKDVFKRVDNALYLAKGNGRNCVITLFSEHQILRGVVEWSSLYLSGNETIDVQHQQIHDLLEALMTSIGSERFEDSMKKLFAALALHFESEERILESLGYERLEEHRQVHKHLLKECAKMLTNNLKGDSIQNEVTVNLLHRHVYGHLITEDFKYFSLMKEVEDAKN